MNEPADPKGSEPQRPCSACNKEYRPRNHVDCPHCGAAGVTRLYKYLPYNENSLSVLVNREIWAPRANTLNDPFEFHFHLTDTTVAGIPIDSASVEKARQDFKQLGVVCFSEVRDNILMWSHYADGHTGFCIELERAQGNSLGDRNRCLPVLYDRPDAPSFGLRRLKEANAVTVTVSTKAPDWEYEKEWRLIVKPDRAGALIELPATITSVILGCRMNRDRRRTIARILKDGVDYYEARQQKALFCLDIQPLLLDEIDGTG